MSAMGGGAVPVSVSAASPQGGPAIPVYGYDSAAEAKADGHTPLGGPAIPVVVLTAADLKENGGTWVVEGSPQALPVFTVAASRAVLGGKPIAVYPVNSWTGS